jgi:hypothetical protein
MIEDIKLPGIITDNNQTPGQSVTKDAADQSTLCGYFDPLIPKVCNYDVV